MTLTFAETHNMIAHITKSNASEAFNQIIDFLKGSSIKDALRLDDADGIECLPNEEIFAELARIGYEKPSTKLTFYKAFFSSQWKFLIDTMLQCMSSKRTSWNEFTSSMASAIICLSTCRKFNLSKKQVGNFSLHSTKYTSTALTQKVFANLRRIVHVEAVNAVGVAAEGGIIANINADEDVVLEDANDVAVENDIINAASTTITAADDVPIPAATIVVAPTLTAAPSRRRKGSKDKAVKRYQALKRKPQTEAQARKNMMIYLRNVVGFKMDYFKVMSYDDIRLIFEKHFDSNVAFLQRTKVQMDEEDSRALKRLNESKEDKEAKKPKLDEEVEELKRHLQIVPNYEDDVYTEATPLARKVLVVDYEIYNENNKSYFKIKRDDGSHQLYIRFLSMLRNFYREDSEVLWQLVKERFATTKPENFSDDFLLITLGAMFEKPDIQA
nr:hypothetical protein [Tanacetum cinerariifolium]